MSGTWKLYVSNSKIVGNAANIILCDETGEEKARTYSTSKVETAALCDGIGIALRAVGQDYETNYNS